MKATYNKEKFSQVMLNVDTKERLDQIKKSIARRIHIDVNEVSYNEVIEYLIKNFNPIKLEYQLERKIAYAYRLKETEIKKNNVSSTTKTQKPKRLVFSLTSNL